MPRRQSLRCITGPIKMQGLKEMRCATRERIVLLTFDPPCREAWLNDYLPELATIDEAQMPRMQDDKSWLGSARIVPFPYYMIAPMGSFAPIGGGPMPTAEIATEPAGI